MIHTYIRIRFVVASIWISLTGLCASHKNEFFAFVFISASFCLFFCEMACNKIDAYAEVYCCIIVIIIVGQNRQGRSPTLCDMHTADQS